MYRWWFWWLRIDNWYNGRYPNSHVSCILYEAPAPGTVVGLPISVIDSEVSSATLSYHLQNSYLIPKCLFLGSRRVNVSFGFLANLRRCFLFTDCVLWRCIALLIRVFGEDTELWLAVCNLIKYVWYVFCRLGLAYPVLQPQTSL